MKVIGKAIEFVFRAVFGLILIGIIALVVVYIITAQTTKAVKEAVDDYNQAVEEAIDDYNQAVEDAYDEWRLATEDFTVTYKNVLAGKWD